MGPIITMSEAAKLLSRKDARSVQRWCDKNNVKIFSEDGTNHKYLLRFEFDHARLKKIIEYLKEKYKENWLQAFAVYKSMNIPDVAEMEEVGKRFISPQKEKLSENEKQILSRLTS